MAKIRQQGTKARNELIEGDIISHFEGETGMMVSRDSRHGVNRILLTLKADVDETSSSIWVDADGSIVNYYGNLFQDLILEDEEKPKGRSVETKNESQENNAPYWLGVELMGGQKLLINLVERDVEILVDSKKDEAEDQGLLAEFFGPFKKKKIEKKEKDIIDMNEYTENFDKKGMDYIIRTTHNSNVQASIDDVDQNHEDYGGIEHALDEEIHQYGILYFWELAHACIYLSKKYKGDRLTSEMVSNARKVIPLMESKVRMMENFCRKHKIQGFSVSQFAEAKKKLVDRKAKIDEYVANLSESTEILTESKKKAERIPCSTKEREEFNNLFGGGKSPGCSLAKTVEGKFYVYTHRARSGSYKKISDIPKKDVEFIESTG